MARWAHLPLCAARGGLVVGWLLLAAAVALAGLGWQGGAARCSAPVGLAAGRSHARVPDLVTVERGGAGAGSAAVGRSGGVAVWRTRRPRPLQPPTREARGTLSVRGLVVAGTDGLACSVPIELELRAGDAVAVLCASADEGWALAETLAGRRRPVAGEVAVDGAPLEPGDRLVAVVAAGEGFVAGGLDENHTALCDEHRVGRRLAP
jgi:hypothetical protein